MFFSSLLCNLCKLDFSFNPTLLDVSRNLPTQYHYRIEDCGDHSFAGTTDVK